MKNGSLVLTVDCGNSNTKFGVFSGDELVANYRISTDSSKTSDEYAVLLRSLLESGGIDVKIFKGAILSSVVPPVQPFLERAIEKVLSHSCITVQPGIKTGVTISAENPKELGADLLCLSVGAIVRHTLPAIVVSLGTATAFVAISSKPSITGVSIAPGILSAAKSLSRTAAQLPQIELVTPKTALGRNTIQSMRSGLIFGFAGLVDRICGEMSKEMEKQPIVVATGGLLNIISKTTTSITRFDPFLSMYGLKALYEKNVENR